MTTPTINRPLTAILAMAATASVAMAEPHSPNSKAPAPAGIPSRLAYGMEFATYFGGSGGELLRDMTVDDKCSSAEPAKQSISMESCSELIHR